MPTRSGSSLGRVTITRLGVSTTAGDWIHLCGFILIRARDVPSFCGAVAPGAYASPPVSGFQLSTEPQNDSRSWLKTTAAPTAPAAPAPETMSLWYVRLPLNTKLSPSPKTDFSYWSPYDWLSQFETSSMASAVTTFLL